MLRLFTSTMLCFFLFLHVDAQDPNVSSRHGERPRMRIPSEKIQVERIAYFTEKIGLTAEEAQVFWPIYNEMDAKRTALFEEKASITRRFMKESDNINEKQLDELLNRLIDVQQKEAQIPAEYHVKFRKVLSARKVMNLYAAETGFRNYLLQKMRERRDD